MPPTRRYLVLTLAALLLLCSSGCLSNAESSNDLSGGGSAGSSNTGGTGGASGSASGGGGEPCDVEVFQMTSGGELDPELKVPAAACPGVNGIKRRYSGVHLYGNNFCLGETEYVTPLTPECTSNADCAAGSICLCPFGFDLTFPETAGSLIQSIVFPAQCIPAECTSPDECGGRQCGLSVDGFAAPVGAMCHTAADECASDADCDRARLCAREGDRWVCIDTFGG